MGHALERADWPLAHRVLSRFTAFVAVDEREAVTDPSSRRKVVEPVHLPATWSAGAMGLAPQMAELAFGAPLAAAPRALDWTPPLATLDRNLLDELARVAEAFAKEPVDPDWRSDEELVRLQALRDRVADPAEHCRAARGQVPVAVQEWLDRLLHLVHEQRRLHAEVGAAAAELGQLANSPLGPRRKGGRWRFWESGV